MNRVEHLLLRCELSEFLDRYVSALDNDRLEEWPSFFTEDAIYEIISKENYDTNLPIPVIRCEGIRMFRDRVLSLRNANVYELPTYRHFISGLCWKLRPDGGVDVNASLVVLNTTPAGSSSIFITGRYVNHLVQEGEVWYIREMRVIYDTLKIPTLLSFPV